MTWNNFQGVVYGDSAFANRYPVVAPYHPARTNAEADFNNRMSSVKITAENGFKGLYCI